MACRRHPSGAHPRLTSIFLLPSAVVGCVPRPDISAGFTLEMEFNRRQPSLEQPDVFSGSNLNGKRSTSIGYLCYRSPDARYL